MRTNFCLAHLLSLAACSLASDSCGSSFPASGAASRASAMASVPSIRLANGVEMPVVAAGTCHRDCSKTDNSPSGVPSNPNFFGFLQERTYRSLTLALDMGYSHIDTALVYRSQKAIGAVLASKFISGELEREDVFITSKVFHGEMAGLTRRGSTLPLDDMTPEEVADAIEGQFETVLEELNVGYVDLMLMHWPAIMDSKDENNRARRLAAAGRGTPRSTTMECRSSRRPGSGSAPRLSTSVSTSPSPASRPLLTKKWAEEVADGARGSREGVT